MLSTLATIDLERLRGGLQRLGADPSLSSDGRDELALIDRLVWLLERTWTRWAAHLSADNIRLETLMAELAVLVPGSDLSSVLGSHEGETTDLNMSLADHERLASRNQLLRETLSRMIADTWAGDAEIAGLVATRARTALRAGLETRPW